MSTWENAIRRIHGATPQTEEFISKARYCIAAYQEIREDAIAHDPHESLAYFEQLRDVMIDCNTAVQKLTPSHNALLARGLPFDEPAEASNFYKALDELRNSLPQLAADISETVKNISGQQAFQRKGREKHTPADMLTESIMIYYRLIFFEEPVRENKSFDATLKSIRSDLGLPISRDDRIYKPRKQS